MKEPVIYKIINLINNKFYVGSTTNSYERFRTHKQKLRSGKHHCKHLQSAWDKYGEDKFIFAVIEHVDTVENLQDAEDVWLIEWVGNPSCYNTGLRSGAPWRGGIKEDHPSYGRAKTDLEKEAISNTLKEGYATGEYPHPRAGKKHSEETKILISQNRKGKMAGEGHYRYGKTVSEEVRKKIGDTQRGVKKAPRVYTEEGLQKARDNMKRNAREQLPKDIKDVIAKFPDNIIAMYDFSNAVYTGALQRITGCICPKHGEFSQYSAQIRKGSACPMCGVGSRHK